MTRWLNFYPSQYELYRKFKKSLERSNHVNLRIFFLILSCEYLLKIILLMTFEGANTAGMRSLQNPVTFKVQQYVANY
jgi:hypothetical protein